MKKSYEFTGTVEEVLRIYCYGRRSFGVVVGHLDNKKEEANMHTEEVYKCNSSLYEARTGFQPHFANGENLLLVSERFMFELQKNFLHLISL